MPNRIADLKFVNTGKKFYTRMMSNSKVLLTKPEVREQRSNRSLFKNELAAFAGFLGIKYLLCFSVLRKILV